MCTLSTILEKSGQIWTTLFTRAKKEWYNLDHSFFWSRQTLLFADATQNAMPAQIQLGGSR
eukprot:2159406-Alexandrium_andersonii.AAC.1